MAVLLAPAAISSPPLLFFQSLATIFVRQDKDDSSFPPNKISSRQIDVGRERDATFVLTHSYALHSSGTDKRRRREVDLSCGSELSMYVLVTIGVQDQTPFLRHS